MAGLGTGSSLSKKERWEGTVLHFTVSHPNIEGRTKGHVFFLGKFSTNENGCMKKEKNGCMMEDRAMFGLRTCNQKKAF